MMTPEEKAKFMGMLGLALCMLAAAAGWMFMRFGQAWSVADLPDSGGIERIVPAYIVAEIAMIPIGAKLCDHFGIRRVLIFAPTLFVIGSMLSIISLNVEMLVVFRFIQGIGAGLFMGLAFSAVGKYYEPLDRPLIHEIMTGAFAIGSIFGSSFGYFLTENINWRAGFIVLSVMMGLGLVMAWKKLPDDDCRIDSKVDWVGMVLAALLFGSASLYTQMVDVDFKLLTAPSLILAAAIIVFLILIMHHARRSASPVIPVHITSFEKKIILLMFMFSLCGLGLVQYFFKLYLTYYDFDIYKASFMVFILVIGAAGPSTVGGHKVCHTGVRPWVIAGCILVTVSLILSHFLADQGELQFAISVFLFGAGLGCIVTELLCALQNITDKRNMGQHTGNLMAVRMVGILVGNAIVGSYIGEFINTNRTPTVIDLDTVDNLIKELGDTIANNIQQVAQSLDNGFLTVMLAMAVATAILAIVGYTMKKDDLEAISETAQADDTEKE